MVCALPGRWGMKSKRSNTHIYKWDELCGSSIWQTSWDLIWLQQLTKLQQIHMTSASVSVIISYTTWLTKIKTQRKVTAIVNTVFRLSDQGLPSPITLKFQKNCLRKVRVCCTGIWILSQQRLLRLPSHPHSPARGKKSISTVCSCLLTYHHSTHLPRSPRKGQALYSADTRVKELTCYSGEVLPYSMHLTRCNKTLNDLHHKWATFPAQQSIFGWVTLSLISLLPWKRRHRMVRTMKFFLTDNQL